jgi:hypothetical protein
VTLALALAWVTLVRIPLVLNARAHLDSDLAVDGLTLLEATRGHWRWHYPGTPGMGILPVVLSLPQALLIGVSPATLVSGGTVAYAALVAATFVLTRRTFGPAAAAWGLVPLTFASTGALWLSARITGGHLLTAAWHAFAFALLHDCLARGGWKRTLALGVWCGLGFALDTMFAVTLAGLFAGALVAWVWSWRSVPGLLRALLVVPAFLAGVLPREIGARVDSHDAYAGQLAPSRDPRAWAGHGRILALECLPRLIVGHRIPGYRADLEPGTLPVVTSSRGDDRAGVVGVAVTWLGLALFAVALLALATGGGEPFDPPRAAVRWGLLVSSAAVLAGFVLIQNILNSDNYRYLVTLLVPWSLGFGVAMSRLAKRGSGGALAAATVAVSVAALFTADTFQWYQRLGWVDPRGRPLRRQAEDPVLGWLERRRDVNSLYGGYWDVYRLSFLTGGRVRGVPFPAYPNRFPEWSHDLPGGRPRMMLVRQTPIDRVFLRQVLVDGGRVVHRGRGFSVVDWPWPGEGGSRDLPTDRGGGR